MSIKKTMVYPNGFKWGKPYAPETKPEIVEGTKVRFTYPCCGNSYVVDYAKPRLGQPAPWTPEQTARQVNWWTMGDKGRGAVSGWCPWCLPQNAKHTRTGRPLSRAEQLRRKEAYNRKRKEAK